MPASHSPNPLRLPGDPSKVERRAADRTRLYPPSLSLPQVTRRRTPGAVLSTLIHGAAILLLIRGGAAVLLSGGGTAGPRGGGGGDAVQFFNLPSPPSVAPVELPPPPSLVPPVLPPPQPTALELPTAVVPPVPPPAPSPPADGGAAAGAGTGGGSGGGRGAGVGTETGPGGGGDERDIFPPAPRVQILPPVANRPKGVRGREYRVEFWVTAEGRVERVVVTPAIPDNAYRQAFHQAMLDYRFIPARTRDGRPVAYRYTIVIGF